MASTVRSKHCCGTGKMTQWMKPLSLNNGHLIAEEQMERWVLGCVPGHLHAQRDTHADMSPPAIITKVLKTARRTPGSHWREVSNAGFYW